MGRDRPVRRSAFTQGSGEGEPGAALRTSAGRLRLDDRGQHEKHGKRAYAYPNGP